jgi:hypothetical protein
MTLDANFIFATNYSLTVNSGSGGGNYLQSSNITISANAPATGYHFTFWSGDTTAIANTNNATTLLMMPGADIAVTANYAVSFYSLTVTNGSGSGSYTNGQQISISANSPPTGKAFFEWNATNVDNPSAATAMLTMPADDFSINPIYVNNTLPDSSVTNGLIFYFKFDDGSGTNFSDSSANGNDGYLLANGGALPAWTAGTYSKAIQFNGVNSGVAGSNNVPFSKNFPAQSGAMTITYWANFSTAPTGTIIGQWGNPNYNFIVTPVSADINVDTGSGDVFYTLTNSFHLADGLWHFFAFTRTGSSMQWYVDGQLDNSGAVLLFNSGQTPGLSPAVVGAGSFSLDDLRGYTRVLSANEIATIYAGAPPPPLPGGILRHVGAGKFRNLH